MTKTEEMSFQLMNKQIEALTETVARLNGVVQELEKRMTALEKQYSADGVYLDGTPDYVKMYLEEGSGINGRK